MSQTSTERLREYLAQLPPQSQALLMREFERAIERGEDTAVANFVLEQLRKVVRGAEEDGSRGRAPTIRRGCCSVRSSRFWSKAISRSGRARSAAPRWCRSGNGWSATVRRSRCGNSRQHWQGCGKPEPPSNIELGGAQTPARRGRCDRQDRHAGAAATTSSAHCPASGRPASIEDLLPIGAVLQAREALDTLNGRLPEFPAGVRGRADRLDRHGAQRSLACRRRSCCRSRCRW